MESGVSQKRPPILAEKAREIFFFPAARPPISREFTLPLIESFRVHPTASGRSDFVRHDRMEHFVVKNVLEKPKRNERLVQKRVNPNNAIFFLDGAEDKVLLRPSLPF